MSGTGLRLCEGCIMRSQPQPQHNTTLPRSIQHDPILRNQLWVYFGKVGAYSSSHLFICPGFVTNPIPPYPMFENRFRYWEGCSVYRKMTDAYVLEVCMDYIQACLIGSKALVDLHLACCSILHRLVASLKILTLHSVGILNSFRAGGIPA